ncbi:F-box/LRR-repeat protein 7-like [Lineus longissimus]|uniref:F-box/LRR-repeat protein 7-like n=1 Tax=Lineus longissimus TaxID=88925 RepID=UPI00315D52B5
MDSDEIPLPELEGESGPPKKLSRRYKSSSSSEMEVETGGGDAMWIPGSGDCPSCPLNTGGVAGVLATGERHSEQQPGRPVVANTVAASAHGSTDYDHICKGATLHHITESQIEKVYEKHFAADLSDDTCEENSPSASLKHFEVRSANTCEGSKVDWCSLVNSKGGNNSGHGVGESEWVYSESGGILDVNMTSQPDKPSQPETEFEKNDHLDGSCQVTNVSEHKDSCSAPGCVRPSALDETCAAPDSLGPNTDVNFCTAGDGLGLGTHDDSCAARDSLGLSTCDDSSPARDNFGPSTRDDSCATREHERPSTSASYASGGCDCSSEMVATLVLQRHHTSAICNLCSRNLDYRPEVSITSPRACKIIDQNASHSQVAEESLVRESKSSCGAFEQTGFDGDSPGGSESDQASALQFNELPVPIVLKIFEYLSRFEQLRKVALVCKFWNTLTQDPELWRVIDLRGQFKLTNQILDRLTSYSDHVTSIDLSDSKLISSSGIAALTKRCHSLQVLKLSRCYSLSGPAFRSIGENCLSLRKLYFDICYPLTDADLNCIAQGCSRLTTLSLNHCDSITDEGVKAVARQCPQLEAINLDHLGKLTYRSLEALSCNCPKLSTVSLMSAVMNDEGIIHLTQLPKLSILDVSNITALTKKSVTRIVIRCKQLTKLNICLMRWVDDDMIEVIARNATNLKTLHCVSCNITDNGLKILADNAKHLEVLDVSWCNDLTAEGVQYIAERCRTLRFISLIRCDRVTMETLTDFVDRYPRIHFSSFFLDAQRLLKKAMEQGYV